MIKHSKIVLGLFISLMSLAACQESLSDKAEREAKDFTRKYCPTPVQNFTRTDSVVFDKNAEVYTYYITFCDKMDDKALIDQNKSDIQKMLTKSIHESTMMKTYVEAGFHFQYICRSEKNPSEVLLQLKIQ